MAVCSGTPGLWLTCQPGQVIELEGEAFWFFLLRDSALSSLLYAPRIGFDTPPACRGTVAAALHAEANALTAQADAIGIDTYAILDDIARTYADATQDEFNAKARDALAAAIARGNQDGGSTAAQAAPAAEPAPSN